MKLTSILVSLALVLGIASAASAVTVYTSDPSWTWDEIADPSTDNITYSGWTIAGPGAWTPGNLIDNNLGTITGGRRPYTGGSIKIDFGSEVSGVGLYNVFSLHGSGSADWKVELFDDGDSVVLTTSGTATMEAQTDIWVDFDGPLNFQYEVLTLSGNSDFSYGYEVAYYTPEPATVAILGLGSLVLLRKRR